jgi:hypothetical protein
MVDTPTSQQIIEAVRNAGWLLEQDSARLLEHHGLNTLMGWAYADPDDPSTSREMDVHGYRQYFASDELNLVVSARVLIECKQSANPYVLIGRELPEDRRHAQPTEHVLRYQRLISGSTPLGNGTSRIDSVAAWSHLGLDALPGSPSLNPFRATQMTRLDRGKTWTADNRGIFTSLMYPLAKALRAAQKNIPTTSMPSESPPRDPDFRQVALHFPVVVTSAPLYVIDAKNEHMEPKLADWVTMTRQLKTTNLTGVFNVDVVTYSALGAYLTSQVVGFATAVAEQVKRDPQRFVSPSAN